MLAKRRTQQVRHQPSETLLQSVVSMVEEVATSAPPMQALAISFSSFLDLRDQPGARTYGPLRDHEVMVSAHHIDGIRNLPFFAWLEAARWDVPLHIENDVNSALRSATEFPTALCVNLGTGIGSAIKHDNRIVHTPNTWSSYQVGHGLRWVPPEELMRKCHCGSVGCLEAAIGARGLTERHGVSPERAPSDVYDQMRDEVIEHLSPAIAGFIDAAGIDTVVLSGRAARGYQAEFDFVGAIGRGIADARPGQPAPTVRMISLGEVAGLHGVALAALDGEIVTLSASVSR